MAMLVEGGRKVGSDLLQFSNFPFENGHLFTQLARHALAQPWQFVAARAAGGIVPTQSSRRRWVCWRVTPA